MRVNEPVTQREYEFPDNATLMSTTDTQSYIAYANAAFVEVSGFSREEIEGQAHNIVRHPDMPPEAFADMWARQRHAGGAQWPGQRLYVSAHEAVARRNYRGRGAL